MSSLLMIVVLGPLLVLGFFFPPAVAFVYSLTLDVNDSWGVSSYLRSAGYESLVQWARGPVMLAAVMSLVKIRSDRRKGLIGPRPLLLAGVLVACQVWILIGQALKGESFFSLPSFVIYTGLPAGLITLAYNRDRLARTLFVAALAIQLSLSFILLMFPSGPWSVFNARNYQMLDTELLGTEDFYEGGLARVGYQERVFAQHYNPQVYGLYSLVGISVGGYLLLSQRRRAVRLLGGIILALGLFGWSVTVPRGATAGVLLGASVVVWRALRLRQFSLSKVSKIALGATACVLAVIVLPIAWESLGAIFLISPDDPGVVIRMDAAQRAMGQMAEYPWFGVPAAVFNADRVGIHQIMGYFAVMFGLPTGLACTWLLWVSVRATRVSDFVAPSGHQLSMGEINMGTMLMGAVLGMGITNNFGAAMLYWTAWAISCVPWTICAQAPGRLMSRAPQMRRSLVQPIVEVRRPAWGSLADGQPGTSTRYRSHP